MGMKQLTQGFADDVSCAHMRLAGLASLEPHLASAELELGLKFQCTGED